MIWRSTAERLAGHGRVSKAVRLVVPAFMSVLISCQCVGAATLHIVGGTETSSLPLSYNPFPSTPDFGSAKFYLFTASMGPTNGLFVDGSNVSLTFEFLGKEAAYTNLARSLGSTLFTNFVPAAGTLPAPVTKLYDPPSGSAPVPLRFVSPDGFATNGGKIKGHLGIAFACVLSNVCYAFFDDGGGKPHPDRDWDDMVLRISVPDDPAATPLPATLPLFAGGLGVIALLARRRKRKSLATP